MPQTEQEAAENWDLGADLWERGLQSFQMLFINVSPVPTHSGLTQEPRSTEGLSWSMTKQLLISQTGKAALKKHQGQQREGGTCHGDGRRGQGQVSRGVGLHPNTPDAKSLSFGKLGLACKNKQKNTAGLAALSLIKQYLQGFEVWRSLGSSASPFICQGWSIPSCFSVLAPLHRGFLTS